MRAKEYAAQLQKQLADDKTIGRNSAVLDVAYAMLGEMKQTHIQRRARTDAAVVAILREYRQKWLAFLRAAGLDGEIRADALDMILSSAEHYPLLVEGEARYKLREAISARMRP